MAGWFRPKAALMAARVAGSKPWTHRGGLLFWLSTGLSGVGGLSGVLFELSGFILGGGGGLGGVWGGDMLGMAGPIRRVWGRGGGYGGGGAVWGRCGAVGAQW